MKELCNVIRTEVNIMAENDQYLRFSSKFFSLKILLCSKDERSNE